MELLAPQCWSDRAGRRRRDVAVLSFGLFCLFVLLCTSHFVNLESGPQAFVMSLRRALRLFALLSVIRRRQGQVMSPGKARSVLKLMCYHYLKKRNRNARRIVEYAANFRRRRRWHVRPHLLLREICGAWYTFIPVLREEDKEEYFKFFRMTPESFDFLLEKVEPFLQKQSKRKSIPPGERLAVTLRYLVSGDSMKSLSYLFLISDQSISNIVLETTAVLWYVLKDEVFEELSEDLWRRKAAEFESMWQFPMCIGAIDGRHCQVQKFPMRGSEFYNYKGFHSIILFAVSDAKYRFVVVDAGARGRESDGGVFARSDFGKLFEEDALEIPPPVYNHIIQDFLPYVFVGDDAFGLHQHLMKPFSGGCDLLDEETVFNYRLSRARRVVENAFGILSARFRVLRRPIIGSETLAQNVVLACVALHNLHLIREDSIPPRQRVYLPPGFADTYRTDGVLKPGRWRRSGDSAKKSVLRNLQENEEYDVDFEDLEHPTFIREKFMDLFLAKAIPWQWDVL